MNQDNLKRLCKRYRTHREFGRWNKALKEAARDERMHTYGKGYAFGVIGVINHIAVDHEHYFLKLATAYGIK